MHAPVLPHSFVCRTDRRRPMDYGKMADEVVESVKGFVRRSVAPIIENVAGLSQRADKHFERLDSLERRANRHAEHLASLESKIQALERKVGK